MKLVDISVISEPAEFIFNPLNVVVTKHFFVFSFETQIYPEHPVYMYI